MLKEKSSSNRVIFFLEVVQSSYSISDIFFLFNVYNSQLLYAVVSRFMRVDTLSLLLSMANIGPYSDVLVVDMVGGLIVGAVAERLGGKLCFT